MEILVPAAGLSTRYPNMRPKYLLYDYKSDLMLKNAVQQFIGTNHRITVAILQEHADKFNAVEHIKAAIPHVNVIVLPEKTKGPADTVYQMLKWFDEEDFEFLVKDCDSFFTHDMPSGNYICVSNISDHVTLHKLSSKSFVKCNDQDIITDIIEKQVVSDTFCVGGYKFESAVQYKETFRKLSDSDQIDGIFVSHIIQDMLMHNKTFITSRVRNYIDVGTFDEWESYNDKPVIFCDIDGTLIKAQSRFGDYNYDSDPIILQENYNKIKEYHDKGAQIFFVTSRETQYHSATNRMLKNLGFDNSFLIMGLNNSSRILINDYNEANRYPRAVAYNIKRDNDNLKDFMR